MKPRALKKGDRVKVVSIAADDGDPRTEWHHLIGATGTVVTTHKRRDVRVRFGDGPTLWMCRRELRALLRRKPSKGTR